MVLFLTAGGLILFFGGVVAVICDPPKGKLKLIALVIFLGTVVLGGASYIAHKEETYRRNQRSTWDSIEDIEKRSPIKIGDKWYKIALIETTVPD
jgi:hypothetical protein